MAKYRFAFVTDARLREIKDQWAMIMRGDLTVGDAVQTHAENEVMAITRELAVREAYDTITEAKMEAFKAIQASLDNDFTATVSMIVSMGASHEQGEAYRRIFSTGRQY